MKNDRQAMILEIIGQENIETQEQLLTRLQARGFRCTQATISRDINSPRKHFLRENLAEAPFRQPHQAGHIPGAANLDFVAETA